MDPMGIEMGEFQGNFSLDISGVSCPTKSVGSPNLSDDPLNNEYIN